MQGFLPLGEKSRNVSFMRYNLHIINCTYFKCTRLWVLACIYTYGTITTSKILNIYIYITHPPPKMSARFFVISLCQLLSPCLSTPNASFCLHYFRQFVCSTLFYPHKNFETITFPILQIWQLRLWEWNNFPSN